MNTDINVIINGKKYSFAKGTSLLEVSKEFQKDFRYPILAAYVDNELCELNYCLKKDAEVIFFDLTSRVGNRIYQKSLIFLLVAAFYSLHDGYTIKVCHSIDKALRVKSNYHFNEENLKELYQVMLKLVKDAIPISKIIVSKKEALSYYKSIGEEASYEALKYARNSYIPLYQMGVACHNLYSIMPINTSYLTSFALNYVSESEFILSFPVPSYYEEIPVYVKREKLLAAFNENYELSKRLNISYVPDLNEAVANDWIKDVIRLDEAVANNRLFDLAKQIYAKKDELKIVLIAGPSSSGKTTMSRKLSLYLRAFGLNPKPLSIDDYFVEREKTPRLANGKYDFESINAIDLPLFNQQLEQLLAGEEVEVPTFNFQKGIKEYLGNKIKLGEEDILIVEGLHALNDALTKNIPRERKFKLYISPLTDLNIDNYNTISTSDVRLLRRIVRDNRTRGYRAIDTIKTWDTVRRGEELYIFPYQDDLDYVYNSALTYEIGVLKTYAEPLLYQIDASSIYYEEVKRLLDFLALFVVVPSVYVPADSILREFIGNSYFE